MGTVIRNNTPNRPSPKINPKRNRPSSDVAILITDAQATGTTLTLAFDQAVAIAGTPQITTDVAGAVPVSAVQTAPNIVAITFDADISLATLLNISRRDPAIRTTDGGYVTSNVFPLAA